MIFLKNANTNYPLPLQKGECEIAGAKARGIFNNNRKSLLPFRSKGQHTLPFVKGEDSYRSHTTYFFFLFLIITILSCSSSKKTSSNLANIFNENDNFFIKEYSFYNNNDSISSINISVNQNKLLFIKLPDTKVFSAHYEITYIVYKNYDKGIVLDSTTMEFSVNKEEAQSAKNHSIKFMAPFGHDYHIEIIARDLQRNSNFSFMSELAKSYHGDKHFYNLSQKNKNLNNTFSVDTGVIQIQNNYLKNDSVLVKYYNRTFALPLVPYSLDNPGSFNKTPDSTFVLQSDSLGNFNFNIQGKGFYLFQKDSSSLNNLALFNFNEEYPYIVHQKQMLQQLEYLCDKREFEKIKNSSDLKKAIDDFWMESCLSEENAKEHIKQYYLRAEVANKFFSSYREGWNTDRGMIFIIFGPPKYIFRSENGERWIYGSDNSVMSEEFFFHKIENPYSSNAYGLDRSPTLKATWNKMTEAWRNGRLF